MKKAVILTLMYAILFSMAAGSFSLYTTSVLIPSTVIYPDTTNIILDDPLCYVNVKITNNQNKYIANSYYRGPGPVSSEDISASGMIRIYMIKEVINNTYKYVTDYIINNNGSTTNIQTITNVSAYSPPHAVVLNFLNFTNDDSLIISSETGTETFDKTINSVSETILLEPIFIDADNCFDVTFSFNAVGKFKDVNSSFSIFIG